MRFAAAACLALGLALPLSAQERPNTILVMDASGSMWGQIDGVNKIVIAREVIAGILADFPSDENLGLTVYGHRTRGDCTDIETVIAPAPGTAQAIIDAVNTINPRGMTPMTDSVIAAAEALRYTEQAATVILVSDGIETCSPDPCAAARALEEAGIGFTAHVVGFDVGSEPEALAQMQCLAAETGGQFLTAANAEELNLAIESVLVAPVEPEPAPEPEIVIGPVQFAAIVRSDAGTPLADVAGWVVTGPDGVVTEGLTGNPVDVDLAVGTYTVTATDQTGGTASADFSVLNDQPMVVTVEFALATPEATLDAPDSVPAGTTLSVGWTGPDDQFDTIGFYDPAADRYVSYDYADKGSPLPVIVPAEVGTYELQYRWRDAVVIASRPITVTDSALVLVAPDSAPGGTTVMVEWKGPDQPNDNIQVGLPGEGPFDYRYTTDGNPVALVMPWEAGTYELRYQFQDRETILTRPITITPGEVSLTVPAKMGIGATIAVGWTGPNATYDNIQVGSVGGSDYFDYAYVTDGNPVQLIMPSVAGDYELRYHFRDSTTIHRQTITVTEISVSLTGPASAGIGATVDVGWDGPGNENDFIGVGRVGQPGYITYEYLTRGNPTPVPMPMEPGAYELRYFPGGGGDAISATPIAVEPVSATLSVTGPAVAGRTVEVTWDGPAYDAAFIGIGRPGETYQTYAYINQGNPVAVTVPSEPGTYEVRFYLGREDVFVATIPLEVRGK